MASRPDAVLARLVAGLPQEVARALRDEAEIEMTEAKLRTPVEFGDLKRSGYVDEPVVRPGEVSITLGFGGPAAPYAVHVHERLDVFHPVGQAKFLESTILESLPSLGARIAARINLAGLA